MLRNATNGICNQKIAHQKRGEKMAREKELFRDYLIRLDEKFPDKEIIQQKECAEFLGLDKRTVKKKYGVSRDGISKVKFARLLS